MVIAIIERTLEFIDPRSLSKSLCKVGIAYKYVVEKMKELKLQQ